MDTLSLLLSMANVTAYSDVLVVDMVGGLLTGAIAERLGGSSFFFSLKFSQRNNITEIEFEQVMVMCVTHILEQSSIKWIL